MKFSIEDEQTIAVINEISWRLNVDPEAVIRAALAELSKRYVKQPTLAIQYLKTVLKKKGVLNNGVHS